MKPDILNELSRDLDVDSPEGHKIVEKMAAAIMRKADRHTHNRELSVSEMRTFLRGTEYHGFSVWLSAAGQKDPHWKEADADTNGVIDFEELRAAVRAYLRENACAVREEVAVQRVVNQKLHWPGDSDNEKHDQKENDTE